MIYENKTDNEQWTTFTNISWFIALVFLLTFSFMRTYLSCKKICKTNNLIKHDRKTRCFKNKLFISTATAELLTYVYFCLIFKFYYSDYPTMPLVNGLSIVVWDYNNRLEGIMKYIIGIVIWVVLCILFTVMVLRKIGNVQKRELVKIGLLSSLRNVPFYFVFQFLLILFMLQRTEELHVLQQYALGI